MLSSSTSPGDFHIWEDMEEAIKIIRRSTHSLFTTYQTFASIATLLVVPSSAAILVSKSLPSSTYSAFLQLVPCRKSNLFDVFYADLSQPILSFFLPLPFTLTFLCLAKASIIHAAGKLARRNQPPPPTTSPLLRLYRPLFLTQIFNAFLILSANTIFFSAAHLIFDAAELLGFDSRRRIIVFMSGVGLIAYSTIIANAFVICNLASIVSATENCCSYVAVTKAFELVRERALVALLLALPMNLATAALEAVFRARVMRPHHEANRFHPPQMCWGFTIVYLHSVFTVLEIIITCSFYEFSKDYILNDYEGKVGVEDGKVKGAMKQCTFA
ncbi:hypothetical protein KSP39_PZI021577 [Platanthera zijinensis]|uniref:Uncharacterized protein n=1 Tax=Platanthera zijinensis TaxID=2320716 RepID=A0AAP0FVM2_9ASPA